MSNSLSKTAELLVNEWPEIFNNIEINAIPVMYLNKVTIKFITGMVWEVDVKNYLDTLEAATIEELLLELFAEYQKEIKEFEYTFDVDLLKKDISAFSSSILK